MGFVYLHILILYSKYFDPMCVHHVNYKMHIITFWGCFWQTSIYHIYHEVSFCLWTNNCNICFLIMSAVCCLENQLKHWLFIHPFDSVWHFLYISTYPDIHLISYDIFCTFLIETNQLWISIRIVTTWAHPLTSEGFLRVGLTQKLKFENIKVPVYLLLKPYKTLHLETNDPAHKLN